jgi:hypothetical protein
VAIVAVTATATMQPAALTASIQIQPRRWCINPAVAMTAGSLAVPVLPGRCLAVTRKA